MELAHKASETMAKKSNASAPKNDVAREAAIPVDLDAAIGLLDSGDISIVRADGRGKEPLGYGGFGETPAYSIAQLAQRVRTAGLAGKSVTLMDGRDFSTDSAKLASVVNRINRNLKGKDAEETIGVLAFQPQERLSVKDIAKGSRLRDPSGVLAKAGWPIDDANPGMVLAPVSMIQVRAASPQVVNAASEE